MAEERELIWMCPERPARGPRPAYDRAQLAAVAMKIADAEGLEAVSMRRVATELGCGTMSLYRYVPSRDGLLDLMVDAAISELDVPERPSGDWRADLTLLAHRTRRVKCRHPWLLKTAGLRVVFGPHTLRALEFGVGSLDRFGLPIDEVLVLFGIFDGYVQTFVQREIGHAEEEHRTGVSEDEWMARSGPYIHQLIESGDYPTLTRIVIDARQPHLSNDERFEYGLERVVDSIAAALPE